MGIQGINIFGQGIQIFLNTFSIIFGCQETVLLHKKALFPFIWRLLYCCFTKILIIHIFLPSNKGNLILQLKIIANWLQLVAEFYLN